MGTDGAPGAIRTPDLLVRSQILYPTELRVPRLPNTTITESRDFREGTIYCQAFCALASALMKLFVGCSILQNYIKQK